MKPGGSRGRRIAFLCSLTGLSVVALAGFLGRTLIHDQWLLYRLQGMPRDQQWRAIVGLVERQRAG